MDSRILGASKLQKSTHMAPSDSRIIQRKQIEKRLENLSVKQYERVTANLVKQNQKLKQDVRTVSQKLKKLTESKKYETQHKRNPQIEEQILKLKKQLQHKYDTMKNLKEQIRRQNGKNHVEEVSTNLKQKKNEIKSIQMQIEILLTEKQNILEQVKDNQIDFQQYLPTRDLTAQLEIFKEDNKNLKRKVYDTSYTIKQNERTAKEALTKIYTLKKQDQGFNRSNRIKSLSVLSKPESRESGQMRYLEEQIRMLKKKKQDVESQLTMDKSVKQTARSRMEKQIRQLLQHHKKLFKKRVRQLTQLNYLQKKQAEMKQQKLLELQKSNVSVLQRAAQTQNVIRKEYRKDWVGQKQGIIFDDSDYIQFKEQCLVTHMFVYRTSDHIVFIRFGYQNPQQKYKYETRIPFDKQALKKMEAKKIASKTNGHLVNLTLSVTKNIITRVQSLWSDGDSSVQGWESQESVKYKYDIMQRQRPISFFGTVVVHPKGSYALQSLGCQILQSGE